MKRNCTSYLRFLEIVAPLFFLLLVSGIFFFLSTATSLSPAEIGFNKYRHATCIALHARDPRLANGKRLMQLSSRAGRSVRPSLPTHGAGRSPMPSHPGGAGWRALLLHAIDDATGFSLQRARLVLITCCNSVEKSVERELTNDRTVIFIAECHVFIQGI